MGLLKFVVYGGIGYLIYQMLFADKPVASKQGGEPSRGHGGSEGGSAGDGAESSSRGTRNARGQFTGREAQGMDVQTHDGSGNAVRHRVGRGVV